MIISAVDKFSQPIKKLSTGLAKAGSMAAGLGKSLGKVAVGITATVGAISLVVAKYVGMLDAIGKTSEKLGVDPIFLQKLRFAAEQTGVKVSALDMGLQRFIRRTAEAARGTGEAKQALEDLNISLFNSDGTLRDVESVFFDVADAIANTKDSSEQIRLAFKFFDSEGVALVTTLRDGSAGLKQFGKEAENLGLLISNVTVDRAEKFADSINRVKKQINAIVAGILGAFLPALDALSGRLTETLRTNRDVEGTFDQLGIIIKDQLVEAFATLIETIGSVGQSVIDFGISVGKTLNNLSIPISILKGNFAEAERAIEKMMEPPEANDFEKRMQQMANAVRNFLDSTEMATESIEKINEANQNLLEAFPNLEKFAEGFGKVFNDGANKFEDLSKLGEDVAKNLEDGLVNAFMNIRTGAEGLKDTMDQIAKAIISELIRIFVVQKAVGAVTGFFGFEPRANGGPVTAGRPYLVGEKGPELFIPGQSGGIVPNNQLAMAGGGDTNVNITYEIKAFDSKGATAAIAEQAPTIVGIVEQSFRKRGKRGPLG